MTGISISLTGHDEAMRRVEAAINHAENTLDMFDQIGAAVVVSTQQRWEREVDPDGNPWPKSVRVLIEGGKTLRDTGFFFNSVTHLPTSHGVEVGSDAIQAAVMQFGATITAKTEKGLTFKGATGWANVQSVTIPARPWLGLDEEDDAEIIAIAGEWIAGPYQEAEAAHAR
ncbi:virion morphogenesis protein [Devosia sp. DBB001]|nr:virion morphogenesis protein [Devosia sp. DBB001]